MENNHVKKRQKSLQERLRKNFPRQDGSMMCRDQEEESEEEETNDTVKFLKDL